MVNPEKRTEENVRAIVEHWLAHGELSIVGKRTIAQSRYEQTGQREREERNHPWMVAITLSNEKMNTGKSLGKTVGQEVISFLRSKAPLAIQDRMHKQIRLWHILKRDRDPGAGAGAGDGGPTRKKGKGSKAYWPKAPWPKGRAAAVMQPKKEAWGEEPAGGWTAEQTAAWERENKPKRQQVTMEERVEKAVAEFIKNPEAVSKKTEEAIKHLGVGPNRHLVEKLAAQVVAYRIESRKATGDSAAGILNQKGLSAAVRAVVQRHEDQH
jgi:hypothetical protein